MGLGAFYKTESLNRLWDWGRFMGWFTFLKREANMRFSGKFLFFLTGFALLLTTSAYAGKVELTTYYPAPHGEYQSLEASNKLKVPVVTSTSPAKTVANTAVGEIWVETT